MHINTLKLTNFRNIPAAEIDAAENQLIALIGHNGAGKTSILEAISLLSPGRGLNRARSAELINHSSTEATIFSQLLSKSEEVKIGTSVTKSSATRALRINGEDAKRQTDLLEVGNVMWFTPRMDRLFLDGAKPRRDFLDRLTLSLFPEHAADVARYRRHLQHRLRLLKDKAASDWIEIEEQQAAGYCTKISCQRAEYIEALTPFLQNSSIAITGNQPDADPEEILTHWLQDRPRDARFNKTHFGAHTHDLSGSINTEESGDIQLSLTSSGQHKRAILDILLAHAKLVHSTTGNPPLVLLDEVTAHLDSKRQQMFLEGLAELGAQVWLATTEETTFKNLPNIKIFHVASGKIT